MNILILITLSLFVLFTARLLSDDWFNPAMAYCVIWILFITGALLLFDADWKFYGIYYIAISCFVYTISYSIGRTATAATSYPPCIRKSALSDSAWNLLLLLLLIGLFKTLYDFLLNGINLMSILNFQSLVNINTQIASIRYAEDGFRTNFISAVLGIFIYALPLCAGYCFNFSAKKRHYFLCLASFFPITLSALVTNGKAGVIGSVFLWISGCILSYLHINGRAPKVKLKIAMLGLFSLLGFAFFLYFVMLLRVGDFSLHSRQVIFQKFFRYAFGHMEVFDYWYAVYRKPGQYQFGTRTFTAVFMRLGLATRVPGVYEPMTGIRGNIYTAFRGVIEDFGLWGGVFFHFITGLISGYTYAIVKVAAAPSAAARTVLAAIYFFIFYSFILSPYVYTSYIAAFFLFFLFLYYVDSRERLELGGRLLDGSIP